MRPYLMHDSDQMKEDLTYELKSIIVHIGSPTGGHYVAYIWDNMNEKEWNPPPNTESVPSVFENDQDLLLNWFEFNDSSVKPVNGASIQHLFGDGKSSKNAYVLIYE